MRDLRVPAQAGDLGRLLLGGGVGADAGDPGVRRIGQVGDHHLPVAAAGGHFHRIVRAEGHGRHGPALVLRRGGEEGRFRRASQEGRGIKDTDGPIGHTAGDEPIAPRTDGPTDRREAAGRLDLAQHLGRRLVLWVGDVEAVQFELSAVIIKANAARFLFGTLRSKDTEGNRLKMSHKCI